MYVFVRIIYIQYEWDINDDMMINFDKIMNVLRKEKQEVVIINSISLIFGEIWSEIKMMQVQNQKIFKIVANVVWGQAVVGKHDFVFKRLWTDLTLTDTIWLSFWESSWSPCCSSEVTCLWQKSLQWKQSLHEVAELAVALSTNAKFSMIPLFLKIQIKSRWLGLYCTSPSRCFRSKHLPND